jgi:hypothetical protein
MKVSIGKYPGPKSKKERKINVKIHEYDIWSLDSTLAYIILPALELLKEKKHGSPQVKDDDVPEELKSTSAPKKENEWETDDNFHKRWEWALNEMIWAFSQVNSDWEDQYFTGETDFQFIELDEKDSDGESLFELIDGPNSTIKIDWEGRKAHFARMQNGFRLFGTYFTGLWD